MATMDPNPQIALPPAEVAALQQRAALQQTFNNAFFGYVAALATGRIPEGATPEGRARIVADAEDLAIQALARIGIRRGPPDPVA